MSKTDKTKPARVQIAEAKATHGGRINWHTDVTFSRYKGDGDWIKEMRTRKDFRFSVDKGIEDWYDQIEDEEEAKAEEDAYPYGCAQCCGGVTIP